jgi:hypothetical protein
MVVRAFKRIKRIRSHTAFWSFLDSCKDTNIKIKRPKEIPSPYMHSLELDVLKWGDKHVVAIETSHRCYDIFQISL